MLNKKWNLLDYVNKDMTYIEELLDTSEALYFKIFEYPNLHEDNFEELTNHISYAYDILKREEERLREEEEFLKTFEPPPAVYSIQKIFNKVKKSFRK